MPPLPQLLLEAVQLIVLHLVGGVLLGWESTIADFLQPHCLMMLARQPCCKHFLEDKSQWGAAQMHVFKCLLAEHTVAGQQAPMQAKIRPASRP